MPIMSIVSLDFEEPHVSFLPVKIWAYMLFPSAGAERDRFLTSSLFEIASGFAKAFNVGVEIAPSALALLQKKGDVLMMAEAAMQPVISGAAKSPNAVERSAGELSGELLLMAIAHGKTLGVSASTPCSPLPATISSVQKRRGRRT